MARIERVDYSTYIKPLEHIQKAHNDTLADMANMSSQSEILDYYLDPERDSESYNLYNNFKQEFNTNVDDFAKNGLTRNNGARLLNLHRNYNKNVANVLDAVKNRETERAEQHKLSQQSNGQIVFGKGQNADYKSVDDYLQGNKGFDYQNLDEIHKFAKNAATAASKREYKDNIANAVKVLENNYYNVKSGYGFNNQEAHVIIDDLLNDLSNKLQGNIDDKDTPLGFVQNMRNELKRRDLQKYSQEDQDKMIRSFITGTYEGLVQDLKSDLKGTDKLARAGATRVSFGGNKYPDTPYTPQSDKFIIQSDYEFDKSSLNNLIDDFLNPYLRKDFLGTQPRFNSSMMVQNGNQEGSYKLATEDDFIQNEMNKYEARLKSYVPYAHSTPPQKPSKEKLKADYKKYLEDFKKYANLESIPDYFYNYGTNVAAELANHRDSLNNYSRATEFDFPYLQYNDQDTPEIARSMLNRASDTTIYSDIKYNAKTGKFTGKDNADHSNIYAAVNEAKPGDIQMWLAPTPLGENYFHVALKIKVGDDYKVYMIPLKAASHFSDAQVTEQLYQLYLKNRDIINELNAKYPDHKITDPNDVKLFKEAKIFRDEFYKQHLLNTIKSTKFDVKDYQVDINKGPEWTDIDGHELNTDKKGNTTVVKD